MLQAAEPTPEFGIYCSIYRIDVVLGAALKDRTQSCPQLLLAFAVDQPDHFPLARSRQAVAEEVEARFRLAYVHDVRFLQMEYQPQQPPSTGGFVAGPRRLCRRRV